MTNSQAKERFGLAALLDIPVGIMSALSNEVGVFAAARFARCVRRRLRPRPRRSG